MYILLQKTENMFTNNCNWTKQKLIDFSHNLSQAYCPGLVNTKSNQKIDFWTTEKLINLSKSLSSAYGVDF